MDERRHHKRVRKRRASYKSQEFRGVKKIPMLWAEKATQSVKL